MTQLHSRHFLISANFCLVFLLLVSLPKAADGQNPPPKNAPVSFGTQPQRSQTEQENFPRQLLEQLSAIKEAALSDDYAYREVAHLTENIGPRPSG